MNESREQYKCIHILANPCAFGVGGRAVQYGPEQSIRGAATATSYQWMGADQMVELRCVLTLLPPLPLRHPPPIG